LDKKEDKENKEMPEDPVEEPTGEEKIQDKAEEAVEEKQEENVDEPIEDSEPVKEESTEEPAKTPVETEKPIKDKTPKESTKPEEKPTDAEPKKETKKEDSTKKDEKDDDFKYIVRIANTDINGDKKLVHGLTSIKGIGMHMGSLIANETGIDKNSKMGDLTDAQIGKIQRALENIIDSAPSWMLNHRKDYETGEDIHLIGPEIDMRLRDEINIMKKIRSYKGIRHERGLTVRGQRTRANNRKGLTLGVSKKRPGA